MFLWTFKPLIIELTGDPCLGDPSLRDHEDYLGAGRVRPVAA